MRNRIPPDAFAYYVALGPERSYRQVAEHYGVTKRGVTKAAARESWTERLEEIEVDARARLDERLKDEVEEMKARHMKLLRAIASRAAKALQEYPLASGMEGVRAAETMIKLERVLIGEPAERASVTVEQTTRQEVDRLLAAEPDNEFDDEPDDDEEDW